MITAVEGARIRLRELAGEDHAVLCRLWGDPEVAHYMAFSAMTPDEARQAIGEAQQAARARPRTSYLLGAAGIADDVLAGTVGLAIGPYRSVYCSRLTVRQDLQNRGYASEIVELAFRFCFTALNAHRAWGVVHENNPAARQALVHAGMTQEGRIRDFFYARGAWHTVLSFSILEDEWRLRSGGGTPG